MEDFGSNVLPFRPAEAVDLADRTFEEMLDGWRNQQLARNLAFTTIAARERLVRRFAGDVGELPWYWTPQLVDEWIGDRRAVRNLRQSTIRGNGVTLRQFCEYVIDPLYGWPEECWERFGTHPVQVCHDWNTAVHAQDNEGDPSRRSLSVDELQQFFDAADELAARARRLGRKGWLAAFRDATLLKTTYAWGLRRREVRMLDAQDLGTNPKASEFGRYGVLYVRWGKAMKGSAPKRRSVLTLFGWSADCLDEWVAEGLPLCRKDRGDAGLWPSERGRRLSESRIEERVGEVRSLAGLGSWVHLHTLRHSYVTHLIEDGMDAKFVQDQVGHEYASTLALYTSVSSDYRTRTLRAALDGVTANALGLELGYRRETRP